MKKTLLFLAIILLSSCTLTDHVSGTSSETENVIQISHGEDTVTNGYVYLLSRSEFLKSKLDSTKRFRIGSDGKATIKYPKDGSYFLIIDAGEFSAFINVDISDSVLTSVVSGEEVKNIGTDNIGYLELMFENNKTDFISGTVLGHGLSKEFNSQGLLELSPLSSDTIQILLEDSDGFYWITNGIETHGGEITSYTDVDVKKIEYDDVPYLNQAERSRG